MKCTHIDSDNWLIKCRDCGKNHDIYMVLNSVWAEACPEDPANQQAVNSLFFVCLNCVSLRLKRPLTPDDFDFDIPCNKDNEEIKTALGDYYAATKNAKQSEL